MVSWRGVDGACGDRGVDVAALPIAGTVGKTCFASEAGPVIIESRSP